MNIDTYISSGVVESYVLGLADTQEAAEMEMLIPQYPELKKAIEEFEISLEVAAFANAVTPSEDTRKQLMLALQDDFVATVIPITKSEDTPKVIPFSNTTSTTQKSWVKYLAAASVILLVASAALNVYYYSKYNEASSQVTALLNEKNNLTADNQKMQVKYLDLFGNFGLMTDPNMVKVSMPGIKGKENNLATVFWDSKTKDVYLLANKLPEAPSDKQYQLWALVDGKPVDAGMLTDCNGICKLKVIEKAQAFAITLEKKGGSPTPNLNELYVMGNVRA